MSEKNESLRQQLEELERIVAWFESEDIEIEEAISQFEKGAAKSEEIRSRLAELDNKITVLKERFDREET